MAEAAADNIANNHEDDVSVAIFLLEICTQLTKKCQSLKNKTKVDGSPVTQADLAVQALVTLYLEILDANFKLLAEEDESTCSGEENAELLASVTDLVNTYFPFATIERDEKFTSAEVLNALTKGKGRQPGDADNDACWILDPIDGTRGFIEDGQYALALGKIVDGELVVSVVSCPNIPAGEYCKLCTLNENENFYPPPKTQPEQEDSWLVAAIKGGGCRQCRFKVGQTETIWSKMEKCSVSDQGHMFDFRFCESINYPPENQAKVASLAASISNPTYRLDGMAKYCLVATGQMEAYLRFSASGKQKAWDHVGDLLVREAGGEVSDVKGIHLNFTTGRLLSHNIEIVASNKKCHEDILELSRTVLGYK